MLQGIKKRLKFRLLSKDEKIAISEYNKLKKIGYKQINDFEAEDVFIIGYPKSGTTLMQHIIAHLVFGFNENVPKRVINLLVTEWYSNPVYPRYDNRHFFKSHELPNDKYKNIIYVVRDGRAAAKSYVHMMNDIDNPIDINQFYNSGGKTFRGTWNEHVLSWWNAKESHNILFIKYEDLITDKLNTLRKICEYLNITRSTQDLEQVDNLTSMNVMRNIMEGEFWKQHRKLNTWKEGKSAIRQGSIDDFYDINEELLQAFEEKSLEALKLFNYPLLNENE